MATTNHDQARKPGRIWPTSVFERAKNGGRWHDTTLGRKLIRRGLTHKSLRVDDLTASDVSNYIIGRRNFVGRRRCKLIRARLVELGIYKPRPKHIPRCRNCGIEYPTRRTA